MGKRKSRRPGTAMLLCTGVLLAAAALSALTACGSVNGAARNQKAAQGETSAEEAGRAQEQNGAETAASGYGQPVEREVARAVALGLVPEEQQAQYDTPVTADEMAALLKQMIEVKDASKTAGWEALCGGSAGQNDGADADANAASDTGREIDRACGAAYLMCAAQVLGDLRMNAMYDQYFTEDNAPWRYETSYCPIRLPEEIFIPGPGGTDCNGDALVSAMIFAYSRCSRLSHMPLLEFDRDWNFRANEPLTRREAILAAVRLYDSFEEEARYITLEEAGGRCSVPQEAIESAAVLPEVTEGGLPLWKGVGFGSKADSDFWVGHYTRDYYEEEFRFAAEQGFDFFRMQLSFTSLQYPDYPQDTNLVNETELEALDEVIRFALENGVHVQISCASMPGRSALGGYGNGENYNDGVFYPTPEEWEAYRDYWQMLARRYADIPPAYVSFELCSEWHPGDEGRLEDFSAQMDEAVAVIRAVTPDRLLMAGFDGDLPAAECMAKKGVAISFHSYEPRSFTYVNQETLDRYGGIPVWPEIDGETWTAERVYEQNIEPFHKLALKYGVGFMVGEWGVCSNPYEEKFHPQERAVADYYRDMTKLFADKGIAWNHFELAGRNAFCWSGLSGFGRKGVAPVTQTYEYDDYIFTFQVDEELLRAVQAGAGGG